MQPLSRSITPFTKYSGTPFRLKAKRITSLGTRSKAFFRSSNIKNNLFLSLNFSLSLLRTNSINSPSPWHKPILHFINIYHLTGSPFPLKISTNELNIHSSGNLSLNKILNMFVKDFKHLSSPVLDNSITTPEGPLAFPIFIRFIAQRTSSTSILLTAPSTLLASMLSLHFQHSPTFPYAPCRFSFDHPHFHRLIFIFKTTDPNNIFFSPQPFVWQF